MCHLYLNAKLIPPFKHMSNNGLMFFALLFVKKALTMCKPDALILKYLL